MNNFIWLAGFAKGYRRLYAVGLVLVLITAALAMVNPYMLGAIVDRVLIDHDTALLSGFLLIMVAVTIVRMVARYLFQIIFEHTSLNVVQRIRESLFHRLQRMDFGFFDRTKTGDFMARMTGDVDMVRHFVSWVVFVSFEQAVVFATSIGAFFTINVPFTFMLLALTPPIAYFAYRLATEVHPSFTAIRDQFSRLNSVVQENIAGNRVIKAFTREGHEVGKFARENDAYRDRNLDAARVWERYIPIIDTFSGVFGTVIILGGGIFVIRGWMTLGELVTFNSFVWAINGPVRMAGWLINDIQRFHASTEKIRKLAEVRSAILAPAAWSRPSPFRGKIEFRNVTFSYGDEPVLRDISFTVEPGSTAGFIGPTGAGKSTILSLIMRFYDAGDGQVLVDDVDVREYDLGYLREQIGLAMQDVFLFSDTLEGNIAYSDPGASMERVLEASRLANVDSFIQDLPEGYDTIVGERGVGLSGGQRQRISLARLLLRNPRIIMLDAVTASVDVVTERHIQETLRSYGEKRTMLRVAQRITSVMDADVVFVLENGRIADRGTHEELAGREGWYRTTFIHQGGGSETAGKTPQPSAV